MSACPDPRLWCAVLGAALHGAAKGKDVEWLASPDVEAVRALAGLDAEAVTARFDPERYRALILAA
ncbi:hypothetical protein RA2_02062 [Roseovarius sp. A-2]|uniref:hypothetical protein n=1 Tax=Roseovarius sp. A-2 TaxID=1570360 RepID=UPI0009CCE6EA|nr:hypothetical protein [Roseovarius sp. A-2]GAW35004.1 hypothetical protein RA2_02062 [Roseovarius sp. A-2]